MASRVRRSPSRISAIALVGRRRPIGGSATKQAIWPIVWQHCRAHGGVIIPSRMRLAKLLRRQEAPKVSCQSRTSSSRGLPLALLVWGDRSRMEGRAACDRLLSRGAERPPAILRRARAEPERGLVDVVVQGLDACCALIGAQEPAFRELDGAVDTRQEARWRPPVPAQARGAVCESTFLQSIVALPPIGAEDAPGLDGLCHKNLTAVRRQIADLTRTDPAQLATAYRLDRDRNERLVAVLPPTRLQRFRRPGCLNDFHLPCYRSPPGRTTARRNVFYACSVVTLGCKQWAVS